MFNTESWPTLQKVGRQLWRNSRRLHYTHTDTPLVEGSVLELALELADYSADSADSNADYQKIDVLVLAFSVLQPASEYWDCNE